MDLSRIKSTAKQNLHAQLGILVLTVLIYTGVLSVSNIIPIVTLVVMGPLAVGLQKVFYRNSMTRNADAGQIFDPFTTQFVESFIAVFMKALFVFLWSLLLVIPGIIKGLSYAMVEYIMVREPDIKGMDALKKSQDMMNGDKMELFTLCLSFIGWIILGAITCGIGFFYVIPYMTAAQTEFFNSIYDGITFYGQDDYLITDQNQSQTQPKAQTPEPEDNETEDNDSESYSYNNKPVGTCPECGNPIYEGEKTCPLCGANVSGHGMRR